MSRIRSHLDILSSWDSYIDPDLSELENLLYQINHDNHLDLEEQDVVVGLPIWFKQPLGTKEVIDIKSPNDPLEYNTKIHIRASDMSDYDGEDWYKYRRLNLETQWKIIHKNKPIFLPEDITVSDDLIKEYLYRKLKIRKDSVVITRVMINGREEYQISPVDNSLLYVGTIRTFVYQNNTELDGVDYYRDDELLLNGVDYLTKKLQLDGVDYLTKKLQLDGVDYLTKKLQLDGVDYLTKKLQLDGVDYYLVPHTYGHMELDGLNYRASRTSRI